MAIFMARLQAETAGLGVTFEPFEIGEPADLQQIDADVIVNCLGFGARRITIDPDLTGSRGHLVYFEPEPLPYLLSHPGAYVFPRRSHLILGGTFEREVTSSAVEENHCRRIIAINREFFAEPDSTIAASARPYE